MARKSFIRLNKRVLYTLLSAVLLVVVIYFFPSLCTLNWKTYVNEKHHFSIKYPSDWVTHYNYEDEYIEQLKDQSIDDRGRWFNKPGDSRPRIGVDITDSMILPVTLKATIDNLKQNSWTEAKYKNIDVAGNKALGGTGKLLGNPKEFVVFQRGKDIFVFSAESDLFIFNMMLRTLKFTDQQ